MLRWLGPRKSTKRPGATRGANETAEDDANVTDDPLAAIDVGQGQKRIYSVSRVNPLFVDVNEAEKHRRDQQLLSSRKKSSSSGYGDSVTCEEQHFISIEQLGVLLEKNPNYVKSIKIQKNKPVPSNNSNSSNGGTLTTIPEGRVDNNNTPIPKPIWPNNNDSIYDYAQYTNNEFLMKDILNEVLNNINETLEGKNNKTPEDMLKSIKLKLDTLRVTTEDDMRKLCINLSNCKKKNSVLRALSNSSSSSGNNSELLLLDEMYQIPSGSSSSGFSDSLKDDRNLSLPLPVFINNNNSNNNNSDQSNVPNIIRNAMIYGTLCRNKDNNKFQSPKKSLLGACDDKPSVWEQYYGVKAVEEGGMMIYGNKPHEVPVFPGGRPEADFTLDLPRSEHLMKRMKKDKRWRCRCRLLASFLGLIFFLLSLMAVSLMLTRGKRMFGSMV